MIAVFGGSFNPLTLAHMDTVKRLLSIDGVTKVIMIPLGNRYNKVDLEDATERYNILKLCYRDDKRVKVSSLDLMSKEQLTTYDYMGLLAELFDEELAFVMGADNFEVFTTWNDVGELIEKYHHIIINRNNKDLDLIIEKDELLRNNKDKFILIKEGLNNEHKDICATKVREAIRCGDDECLDKMICEDVKRYVKEKGLYV